MWGDPDETLSIRVDKTNFQVTVNPDAALLRLRDGSFERMVVHQFTCARFM